MTRDELEFSISQYLDGTLGEHEESALVARLATDSEARALLAEYRGLDRALRAAPLPAVDYDALGERICDAVAREPEPAQSYRLHWVKTVSALALAACVVIAAGLGIRRMQSPEGPGGGVVVAPEPTRIEVVDAVSRPMASTQPVVVVNVGPPAAGQDRSAYARYDEDLLSRPSQVIIARSGYVPQEGAAQDGPLAP